MTNDWKSIHEDFTPRLQREWEEKGFEYKQVKEWFKYGLKLDDAKFADYLEKRGYYPHYSENIIERLREEYVNWNDSDIIFNQWEDKGFAREKAEEWIEAGLKVSDHIFAAYLRWKGYQPNQALINLEHSREEFVSWLKESKSAQGYLDIIYPWKKRIEIENLDLSNQNLTSNLNLSDFSLLKEVNVSGNPQLRMVEGTFIGTFIGAKAQEWLNRKYFQQQKVEEIKPEHQEKIKGELIINDFSRLNKIEITKQENLTELQVSNCPQLTELSCNWGGLSEIAVFECSNLNKLNIENSRLVSLGLGEIPSLKVLSCQNNQLANLNLSNCSRLKEINCSYNHLQDLVSPSQGERLTYLDISNNNLFKRDLSMFSHLVNLERLYIGNTDQEKIKQGVYNHFYGSLQPLQNLTKLKELNIDNTDIDGGVEHLPENLSGIGEDGKEKISYSIQKRPESKIKDIELQLDLFKSKKQKDWEERGFTIEQIKQWMKLGLTAYEYDLADYLQKEKKLVPQEITNKLTELRKEYSPLEKWKNHNFTYEQIKEWKDAGLQQTDADYAKWLRDVRKVDPKWICQHDAENQGLKEKYKRYGLCRNCCQLNTEYSYKYGWCQFCNSSGNEAIDKFIQRQQQELKWIPYEQFTDVEYLANGGFAKIYKAKWKNNNEEIALKILNDSQNVTTYFLQEVANHVLLNSDDSDNYVVKCHGISQDPQTKNYVMVIQYIRDGNMRQYLQKNYNKIDFRDKLIQLRRIARGLSFIHEKGLVHQDFHSGNILNDYITCYITDLGLCRPADEEDQEKIYGVLPYIAPELFHNKRYIQPADIYSFGIVAYELFSGSSPYHDLSCGEELASLICEGLRPQFNIKIPPLLESLIKQCWDADPLVRPTAQELEKTLTSWNDEFYSGKKSEFCQQYREIESEYNQMSKNTPYKCKMYTVSRLLEFKGLPQPQNSEDINEQFYSQSKLIDEEIKKIEKGINLLLDEGGLKELAKDFIRANQRAIKGDEIARNDAKEMEKRLKAKLREVGFSREDIKKVIRNCEKLVSLGQQAEKEQKDAMLFDWTNVNSHFTLSLVKAWQDHNFTFKQARDWININSPANQSQAIQEPEYYAWLRDIKKVSSDWVLNHGDHNNLRQEYQRSQQFQAQIIHQT